MKRLIACLPIALLLIAGPSLAEDDVSVVAPATAAAEGLDLHAVAELFKESESLEQFEKSLNDPESEINNLDLDGDEAVDYIRVVTENPEKDSYLIILQVALGEDAYQDVAVIEAEKGEDDVVKTQITGDPEIYGPDYYVVPATVIYVRTWPTFRLIFAPGWRPYRSPWRWGLRPKWWRPRPIVSVNVYHTRTVRWVGHGRFVHTHVRHTTRVHKHYHRKTTVKAVTKTHKRSRTTVHKSTTTTVKKKSSKVTKEKTVKKGGAKKGSAPKAKAKAKKKTTKKKPPRKKNGPLASAGVLLQRCA